MRRAILFLTTVMSLGLALPARAQAEDPAAYQNDYQAGDYGRVRSVEDGATILRGSSEAWADTGDTVSINTPVFPGDTIRTDDRQRIEIQLAGGTLLRADRGTDLTFQALPDPSAQYSYNTVLKLTRGTVQVSARARDKEEFRVDTPGSSIYLLGTGDFRVDVEDRGRTRVQSEHGVAEVVGEGGSVLVRGGMRTVVYPGSVPDDPRAFNTFAEDTFDRWVAERDDPYGTRARRGVRSGADPYDEIPYEVRPYYRELAGYGGWVDLPAYGHVWYPNNCGPGWRPYLDGHWYYGPEGYFWVSSEPWGWAPYHYGRWTWAAGYGWCWIPGRVFAGAWVSWSWGPSYVGWCPLDYWNRPAFYGTLYYGHYDPACWTFVNYGHIAVHDCRRYAVPADRIGVALQTSAVVTRAPRVAPRALAEDLVQRERAIRAAAEDRRARILPVVNRELVPRRSFVDAEREARQRFARPLASSASSGNPASPPTNHGIAGARRSNPGSRSLQGRVPTEAPRDATRARQDAAPYPRRNSIPDRSPRLPVNSNRTSSPRIRTDDGRGPTALPRGRSQSLGRENPTAPDETRRTRASRDLSPAEPADRGREPVLRRPMDRGESRDTGDRVRDMYRRIASPRVAREREEQTPRTQPQGPGSQGPVRHPEPRMGSWPRRMPPTPPPPPAPRMDPRPSQPRTPEANGSSSHPRAGETRGHGKNGRK